ncbi:scp-like extracellular [Stagonosporopsis vannaccii]|nr:scp-like extracellular [Stagonosporopsis vannaccii]
MRSSSLLTSALAASAFALPQGELEKRQQVTVIDTVTVTTTVYINPRATPAVWAGPPKISNPPNTRRPTNVPPPPSVSIPRPDAGRTSTPRPGAPSTTTRRTSSSTITSTTTRATSTSTTSRTSSTTTNTGGNTRPTTSSSTSTSSAIVGSGVSNAPVPSTTGGPVPSGAPIDPGHTPGAQQAYLTPADGAAYRNSILYHHNIARANHRAVPLVWNDTVAATARLAAETCDFEHYIPDDVAQGQNLFTVSGNYFNVTAGITESWYKEEFPPMVPYFGATDIPGDVFPLVGHLTQLLWNGTTSVGCYSLDCTGRMKVGTDTNSRINKYTVCNYWPAGNVGTLYAANIGRPISSVNLGSWIN